MIFDCTVDAPVERKEYAFFSSRDLVVHRDTYMRPCGEALSSLTRDISGTGDAQALYRATLTGNRQLINLRRRELLELSGCYHAHKCFFQSLGGGRISVYALMRIHKSFGSADSFFRRFKALAAESSSEGFLWLCCEKKQPQALYITFTKKNALLPPHLSPLLCLDLWEHAYKKNYGGDRYAYAADFLMNTDWSFAE